MTFLRFGHLLCRTISYLLFFFFFIYLFSSSHRSETLIFPLLSSSLHPFYFAFAFVFITSLLTSTLPTSFFNPSSFAMHRNTALSLLAFTISSVYAQTNADSDLVGELRLAPSNVDRISTLSNDSDYIFNFLDPPSGVTQGAGGYTVAASSSNFPAVTGNGVSMSTSHSTPSRLQPLIIDSRIQLSAFWTPALSTPLTLTHAQRKSTIPSIRPCARDSWQRTALALLMSNWPLAVLPSFPRAPFISR